MKVKELMNELSKYPEDLEIMTKNHERCGNIGYVNSIFSDSYGFFGLKIPCLILSDHEEND